MLVCRIVGAWPDPLGHFISCDSCTGNEHHFVPQSPVFYKNNNLPPIDPLLYDAIGGARGTVNVSARG